MPGPQEQALLELLHQEQQRNGTAAPVTAEGLPDLDPTMLLSVAAQRELSAAQNFRPEALERALRPHEASAQDPDLASIFLDQAARETGLDAQEYAVRLAGDEFEVGYDTSFHEGTTAPNEGVRFQVGRESPVSTPFYGRSTSNQDGVVVGQIDHGRLRLVEPAPRPVASNAAPVRYVPAAAPTPARSRIERLLGPSLIDD